MDCRAGIHTPSEMHLSIGTALLAFLVSLIVMAVVSLFTQRCGRKKSVAPRGWFIRIGARAGERDLVEAPGSFCNRGFACGHSRLRRVRLGLARSGSMLAVLQIRNPVRAVILRDRAVYPSRSEA